MDSVPANVDDGYKAALKVFMASDIQGNITQVQVIEPHINSEGIIVQEISNENLDMEATVVHTDIQELQIAESDYLEQLQFEIIGINDKGKKQYRCCTCYTLCSDPTVHRLVHSEDRPYMCDHNECGKTYKSKAALKYHKQSTHAVLTTFQCSSCGKNFKTEYLLKKHLSVTCNDHRPFICRTCSKSFKTLAKLKYHEGTHVEVKPYQCNICFKPMATKAHLKVHMIIHDEGDFTCFCGKQFKSSKRYKEHYKFIHDPHHPYRCDVCERNFKNTETLEHHKTSHERPFSCRVCKKGFMQVLSCRMHERLKHRLGEAVIQNEDGVEQSSESNICPVCSKVFKNNQSMEIHLTVHTLDDIFPCPQCDKRFKLKKHLLSHMSVHGDRTIQCPRCDKKFKHEKNLKLHMTGHLKPYQCQQCGARFSNERYLQTHKEKHKKGAAPKIYRCPHCDVICPTNSNIKIHMEEMHPDKPKVTVTPETPLSMLSIPNTRTVPSGQMKSKCEFIFNCEICNEAFDREAALTSHEIQKHSNVDKPSCSECGVKFMTPRTMKRHLFYDHDIGQLQNCDKCDREFFTEDDLNGHREVIHIELGPDNIPTYRLKKEIKVEGMSPKDPKENISKPQNYICIVCTKCFVSEGALLKHEMDHQDNIFHCRLCDMSFLNISELKSHCNNCSDTQCMYCSKEFNNSDDLKRHITFHQMGKIVYKCSICSKEFNTVLDLKQHKVDHEELHFIPSTAKDGSQPSVFKSLLSNFVK